MALVHLNGSDLYCETVGAGEPVLFLHGGFCSLESLRPQYDAVAQRFSAHAFERAGHGRSADIEGDYSYEQGVADALAYLDVHGLDSVHIVGYSDGANIGLMLALAHPHRVRSLVAISGNLDPTGFAGAVPGTVELSAIPDATPTPTLDSTRLAYEALSPDGPGHADAVLAKLVHLWTTEPHIALASLASIAAPCLIVSADRDTIRPDHSLLIAASIPGARLCIVPGATHGLIEHRSSFVTFVILDFLAGVSA